MIRKHLRMEWTDIVVLDRDLPDFAVRVALTIGTFFNDDSGLSHLTRETIAARLGCAVSKVVRAVSILERRGLLIVKRRDLGARKDGRRVFGGKGIANTYAPGLDGSQVTEMTHGKRLVDRVRRLKDENTAATRKPKRPKNGSLCEPAPNAQSDPNLEPKRPTDGSPTLKEPSVPNSTSARASGGAPARDAWHRIIERLIERLGKQEVELWFIGRVSFVGVSGETITLRASPYYRDRIIGNAAWADTLLTCCRIELPPIRDIEWITRP